jgi:signal transduction histidine kinase
MYRVLAVAWFCFLLVSCTDQKPHIKIGISHASIEPGWGSLMFQEIENEFSLYNEYGIELIVKDAKRNNQKQAQDILDLYKEGIDALIVFPFDSQAPVKPVEYVYDKGVPVVIIDRKLNTAKYSAFVSCDNVMIGSEAGIYALHKLGNKGKILEIMGSRGSSTSIDRSVGFRKVIKGHSEVTIHPAIYGEWLEDVTQQKTDSVLKSGFIPDLIFAHNDNMAQSAQEACKKYGIRPIIVGVDALPGDNGGINMVINNRIDATFYNYPGGDKAAQLAMALVQKKSVPKDYVLKTFPIDVTNAVSIKVAYNVQMEQYSKIKKQQVQISNMFGVIHNKDLLIYLSLAIIVLLVLIVLAVVYFLKQKQKFISLIEVQKKKIEQQVEEEKCLTEELMRNNMLLESQREEIVEKNEFLETYRNRLEQLIQERTKDLIAALDKAKESDKLKSSFLSNLSHEIRTPLNSIMGFTNLLTTTDLPQVQKDNYKSIIEHNCNQLLNSITQIVEVAKLSTEKVEFKKEIISVALLFDQLHNELSNYINASLENTGKHIEFKFITPSEAIIKTDVFYIKQAIGYLIDNALKFTNNGYIHVGFEIVGKRDARFYVSDTGIGIRKENHGIIFDKFRKIEDNPNILFRGVGLGLSITKQIVELMGGSVSVKSEIGVGSEFSLIVPKIVQ